MSIAEWAWPATTGFVVALATSFLIVATRRWHGRFSIDNHPGPHKYHDAPAPRIGGIALLAGILAVAAASPPPVRGLLFAICIGSLAAFAAGLAEDVTNSIPPAWRLTATFLAAWCFCHLSGHAVTRVDVPLLDAFLALPQVSVAATVFLLAGFTHAVNIVDGFHGLVAGITIIMLCALGGLAHSAGDAELTLTAVAAAAVLMGFMLVNFPSGLVFLGDGGAYVAGFVTGSVAIMLAARNPDVSAWAIAVVVAYPALEALFSIARKSVWRGRSPFRPDEMHLHHMLHRRLASRFSGKPNHRRLANPLTGVILWGGPLMGLLFVVAFPHSGSWALLFLALQSALYLIVYRLLLPLSRSRADLKRTPEADAYRLGPHRHGRAD